jgi:hypothetical protein
VVLELNSTDLVFELNPRSSESCKSKIFKVVLEKMASSSRIEIEKFNGQKFEIWKIKIEDLLVDREQWEIVYPSTIMSGMSREEREKLERREKSMIRLRLADSVLLNVSSEDSTKKLWDKLGSLYQMKSLVKVVPLE